MLDLPRTVQLVKGGLLDAEATWRAYLPEAGDWKKTAALLTGPLIVASAVVAYLLGVLGAGASVLGAPTFTELLLSIIWGAIAAALVAFVFGAFASWLGGRGGFAIGLAATTLAFIPGYVGRALSGLPWIGWLLGVVLAIYSLILLWRISPIYFEVPSEKRTAHYVASLLTSIVASWVVGMIVGIGALGEQGANRVLNADGTSTSAASGGLFGGITRQADLISAAEADRYAPPSDGKLTEQQVQDFIRVMERAKEASAERQERIRQIAEQADSNQRVSLGDLSTVITGITEVAGLNTAEIEIVKSTGGNWAEHQWVRETLRAAWLLKDGDEAVVHNYGLYRRFEEQLAEHIVQ